MPITSFTGVKILISPQIMLSSGSSDFSAGTSIDLSGYAKSLKLTREWDQKDVTVFGMTDHAFALGLAKWQAQIDVMEDYSSGGLQSKLWPLVGASTPWFLFVRPDYSSRTPANPEYTGPVRLASYNPINGTIGEAVDNSLTFVGAGSLTRVATCSS